MSSVSLIPLDINTDFTVTNSCLCIFCDHACLWLSLQCRLWLKESYPVMWKWRLHLLSDYWLFRCIRAVNVSSQLRRTNTGFTHKSSRRPFNIHRNEWPSTFTWRNRNGYLVLHGLLYSFIGKKERDRAEVNFSMWHIQITLRYYLMNILNEWILASISQNGRINGQLRWVSVTDMSTSLLCNLSVLYASW